ncbi:unnamed protein product [Acanthoscelides obtectus]|uniref:Uncharacterized protein n=1 Tax=Acanthoscelides obtectus TaxID=200917 RepID=A0A9P0KHQ1_ACAOB|nr:unnamed protein product [Acanthoscelides obtectus]CAK1656391.1 hypothetical protein AOBTE_LOCUS19683 [Acanthoscelides obtectus]
MLRRNTSEDFEICISRHKNHECHTLFASNRIRYKVCRYNFTNQMVVQIIAEPD